MTLPQLAVWATLGLAGPADWTPELSDWDETTSVAVPPDYPEYTDDARNRAYLIVIAGSNVGEMHKIETGEVVLGRSVSADVRLVDDGISREHCRIRVDGESLLVEDLESRNGTYCNGARIARHQLEDGDKLQLGRTTILKFTYHDQLDESFQRQMLDSALRDGLTKAYNKRYFMDRLESEIRFAHRHRVTLSLLLLDLDHFKLINDTHGHVAGDRVLATFAATVHKTIRNEDVFARYGGEEFAIISRSISRNDAYRFGERVRRDIEQLEVEHNGVRIPVTVSIGIATIPEDPAESPTELVQAADSALYRAKEGGRNRVFLTASRPDS